MISHHTRTLLLFTLSIAILACACLARGAEASGAASPTPLTRELLLSSLARDVSAQFNLEGDLQLELIRPWTPPARVAAAWEVSVIEFPAVPSSSLMLRCRILADGAPVMETSFVLRAQLWCDAWATRQPIALGATFDVAALEARRVDKLRERDVVPASVGDRSYVFARAVTAGRLLTWRDITSRPLVKKGDVVEVAATEGTLTIMMKGVAMESGARGDTVTVRNQESRKDFSGLVVAENRVQVRF